MNIKNKLLLFFTCFAASITNQSFTVIVTAEVLQKGDKIVFLLGDIHASDYSSHYYNKYKNYLKDASRKKLESLIVDYIILELEQIINVVKSIKKINKSNLDIILEQNISLEDYKKVINYFEEQFINLSNYKFKEILQNSLFSATYVTQFTTMRFFEILANNIGIPTTNIDFRPDDETYKISYHLLTNEFNKILEEIKNYKNQDKILARYYKKTYEDYIKLLFTKPESEETNSAYHKLVDVRTVYKIMNSDKKILIVVEGFNHTNNISTILKTIGFKVKEKLDYYQFSEDYWKNYDELIKEKIIFENNKNLSQQKQKKIDEADILDFQIRLPILQPNMSGKVLQDFMQRHLEQHIKIKSKL